MTTNPDSVVALTTALLLGKVSTRAENIRTSIVSCISAIDNRTCAVLNALAALCVSEPKSEVIAIACRYQKPNTELIIAANNGPPSASTLKHLKSIWDSLSDISDRMLFGKQLPTDPRVESPEFDLTQTPGNASFRKLLIDIYNHSFKVAQKRNAKYLPIVKVFDDQYAGWIEYNKSKVGPAVAEWKFKATFSQFRVLLGAFTFMNKQLLALENKDWIADADEVDDFIETWYCISDLGKEVLKNPTACDTWAEDVKAFGTSNNPCRLRRAIEKLCTIHFQVGTLIRFAFSARMRFLLSERSLRITPVKPDAPTNQRAIPSTETGWRKVLQGILGRQEIELEGSLEESRANEKKIFDKALAQKSRLVEHCECLLVTYLLRHNSPTSISYIGVSKLSCKACFLWLQAVGEVTDLKFNTRRCNDKWYPGWSTPALSHSRFKDRIHHVFLEKVESELCEGLKASNFARPRARSDSSNSSEGGKAVMKLKDKAKRYVMLTAESDFLRRIS